MKHKGVLELDRVLWDALLEGLNIYNIAERLCLSADASVDDWRIDMLYVASEEGFWEARPAEITINREEWEAWRHIEASPRRRLTLLRTLVGGTSWMNQGWVSSEN